MFTVIINVFEVKHKNTAAMEVGIRSEESETIT